MVPAAEQFTLLDPAPLRRLTDAQLERLLRLAGFEAAARDCRAWRAASTLADELHDRQRFPPTSEAPPRARARVRRPAA